MTSVTIASIIKCSSQDARYPASNLLKRSGGSWLCSPDDAKLNRVEVSLRLSLSCIISHIDIGNHGSFSVEVQVSCDDNPYETLINQSTFMSVSDSRLGKNLHSVKMFKSDDFDASVRGHLCDKIKLICLQPYRKDKPFGLAMVKVMTDSVPNGNCSLPKIENNKMQEFMKQHRPSDSKSSNRKAWFEGAVQGRLEQIANTGKISSTDRSMRMVMASVKSPSHKTPLVNELLNQKSSPSNNRPTFMGSVRTFFRKLDYSDIDPYTMKVSELRHQFEKIKARKLGSDEKKLFKTYTLEFFASRVGENSRESQSHAEGRAPVKKAPPVDKKTEKLAKDLMTKLASGTPPSPMVHDRRKQVTETPPVIVLDDEEEFLPQCSGSTASSNSLIDSPSTHPVHSTPTHLVRSIPTHPVQSTPTHLVRSIPTHPVQSTPTHSVQSTPTHSVQSTPTHSVQSSPTHSVQSTPTPSVQLIPTHPVQSIPTHSVLSTLTHLLSDQNNEFSEMLSDGPVNLNTSSDGCPQSFLVGEESQKLPQVLDQLVTSVTKSAADGSCADSPVAANSSHKPSAVHTITKKSVEEALNNVAKFMAGFTPIATNLIPASSATAPSSSLVSPALSEHKSSAFSPITSTPQSQKSIASPKCLTSELQPTMLSTPLNTSALWATNLPNKVKDQSVSSAIKTKDQPILTPPQRANLRYATPKPNQSPKVPVLHLKPPRSAATRKSNSKLSTPSTPKSQPRFNKRSTAVSPGVVYSHLPRNEIRPAAIKRTIAELLSDDDDDLMLPVSKKSTNDIADSSRKSITSSQLTLQDLISSDEDDEIDNNSTSNLMTTTSLKPSVASFSCMKAADTSANATNKSMVSSAFSSLKKPIGNGVDVVVSSDSDEDLPDIQIASDDESIPDVFGQPPRPEQSEERPGEVQCPICQQYFPVSVIAEHASDCIIE